MIRILHTDGSANPNPGPGGYAVIENGRPIALGSEDGDTTNIRMEGKALIAALRIVKGAPAEVHTDSEFWINVATKWAPTWKSRGWTKKGGDIKNLDIVKELYELHQASSTTLVWVRGHNGNDGNEQADHWANEARKGKRL